MVQSNVSTLCLLPHRLKKVFSVNTIYNVLVKVTSIGTLKAQPRTGSESEYRAHVQEVSKES